MDNKMTVFFSKFTGEIESVITGGHWTMDKYGDRKAEMELIRDYIVIDFNATLLRTLDPFTVNLDTRQVELKKEYLTFTK